MGAVRVWPAIGPFHNQRFQVFQLDSDPLERVRDFVHVLANPDAPALEFLHPGREMARPEEEAHDPNQDRDGDAQDRRFQMGTPHMVEPSGSDWLCNSGTIRGHSAPKPSCCNSKFKRLRVDPGKTRCARGDAPRGPPARLKSFPAAYEVPAVGAITLNNRGRPPDT